jgi:predicted phosphate transport protein (TIGR00153 family)
MVRLLPRDQKFFDLFTASATYSVQAARYLSELLQKDESERAGVADTIKELERQADDVTHEVVTRLDRTFITPLDREDIHLLASRLDDVTDMIDGIARRSQIFKLGPSPVGAIEMAGVVERAAQQLLDAVRVLGNGRPRTVLAACVEIKRLEEEGDTLYHDWLGRLFEETTDPVRLMKWKEIYDSLERTLDVAEDVSNVLESVAIKHG